MDQLVIALDVDSRARALALTEELGRPGGAFKIGSRLFTSEGPDMVRALAERGSRVFLDLKYHDIPSVVAGAVRAATELGVWMLTVHAAGGRDMLKAAAEAAREAANGPIVVAVTVLTSLDEAGLERIGVQGAVENQVDRLAALAQDAGVDGVVASPLEIERIRARHGRGFAIVTPGIRGRQAAGEGQDDQARTLSAGEAVRAGADYIVVGRPIIGAASPRAAAEAICLEIAAARA